MTRYICKNAKGESMVFIQSDSGAHVCRWSTTEATRFDSAVEATLALLYSDVTGGSVELVSDD